MSLQLESQALQTNTAPSVKSTAGWVTLAMLVSVICIVIVAGLLWSLGVMEKLRTDYGWLSISNIFLGTVICTSLLSLYKKRNSDPIQSLGLRVTSRSWVFALGTLVITFGCAVGALAYYQGIDKMGFDPQALTSPSRLLLLGFASVAWMFAAAHEELLFRGMIFHWLKGFGVKRAICISAVLFAIIHMPFREVDVYKFIQLTSAGIIYSFLFIRSGSLFDCIVAHAIHNLISDLVLFMQPGFSMFAGITGYTSLQKLGYEAVLFVLLWLWIERCYPRRRQNSEM